MRKNHKPDLVVRYRENDAKMGLLFLGALSPLWLIWMPWVMFILGRALIEGGLSGSMDLFGLLCYLIFMFFVCVSLLLVCLDNRLVISQRGLHIPVKYLLQVHFRCNRKWDELSELIFMKGSFISTKPALARLQFSDFSAAIFCLDGFAQEDIEKLILSLEAYRPDLPKEPPLATVDLGMPVNSPALEAKSFTQIWEEDLSSRFGSTIFVPLEPGETLQNGRLKIIGQVAFGGLSAIYLAELDGAELVVLKEAVVPPNADSRSAAKALEMFEREAKLLIAMKHDRIARVLDHFVEQSRHYLILEHVEGKDLRKFVKEMGPQPERMVLRWAVEIAEILEYLHGLNPPVIHRDLTPDNLILNRDGSITLIDFGAANTFLGTATGTLVGKQSYISPEQFRGKAVPQSDIYSLGGTLHFLLTGKDPVPLAVSSPRAANPDVSDEVDRFVQSLTELEPSQRVTDSSHVRSRAQEILDRSIRQEEKSEELEHQAC